MPTAPGILSFESASFSPAKCFYLVASGTGILVSVTARAEFDSRTGEPEMDIDWTFGDYSSLYAKERGLS
jgi:hypothetical protein